jgi:hypothetical protein
MKRGVKRGLVLQYAAANVEQFPHGSLDDDHLCFPPLSESLPEGLGRGVASKGRDRREVQRLPEPRTPYLRQTRFSMNRTARFMMGGRQAGVGGRLASTLEALVIPELGKHQRGGRRTDAGNRFQKHLLSSKGPATLNVIVNRLFERVDLLVDAFEYRLKRAGDGRISRPANLVFQAVTHLFQALEAAAGHVLQVLLLRRRWLPGTWRLPPAEASQETGVDRIGFRPVESAVSVGAGASRIHNLWRSDFGHADIGQLVARIPPKLRDKRGFLRSRPRPRDRSTLEACRTRLRYSVCFEIQNGLRLCRE